MAAAQARQRTREQLDKKNERARKKRYKVSPKRAPITRGRPTKYRVEMCDKVITLGEEGTTWTGIAVELKITRDTLYAWKDKHEEFSYALSRARISAQMWWEKRLRGQATDGVGSATAAIFAMKNQFPDDYKDRKEHRVEFPGFFEIDFQGYEEEDDE